MKVVDYDYIVEVSTADALKQAASDVSSGYNGEIPGVNTFKINAETSIYNEQGGGGTGIAGWSTNIGWSSTDYNTVRWTSGSIYLPDGTEYTVTSGNTGDMSTMTYIYYDEESGSVLTTTSASDSVGEKKILLCVAGPTTSGKDAEFQAFGTNAQSTFIYADNIAANTITASEIASNSIETRHLDAYSVTSSKIDTDAVTADKIDVSYLSAINADLGYITAGDIKGTTITAGNISSGAGITLYPSGSTGYLDFYYSGSRRGRIQGTYVSGVGNCLGITGSYIALDGDVYCLGKLRIPVGTDLY